MLGLIVPAWDWIYRFPARQHIGGPGGKMFQPGYAVCGPEAALGSRPRVALSSVQTVLMIVTGVVGGNK